MRIIFIEPLYFLFKEGLIVEFFEADRLGRSYTVPEVIREEI